MFQFVKKIGSHNLFFEFNDFKIFANLKPVIVAKATAVVQFCNSLDIILHSKKCTLCVQTGNHFPKYKSKR